MIRFSHSRTVAESLREYGQGIAGGPMFSIPLFYTLEMWNSGSIMEPWRILLLYNRYVGLRRDATFAEVAIGSVGEMGIGLLLSAGLLTLLGIIGENGIERESGFTLDLLPPGGKRTGRVSFAGSDLPAKTLAHIVGHTEP